MPKLPSYNEFKSLLIDNVVFRDHFNVFLQLPVFARRFCFSPVTKIFDVCPYPSSNFQEVDHHCVWQWIYLNRLPLFWTSEYFYSYRLCYELYNSKSANEVSSCTTKDFQKFILFLRCSPGEAFCLLWMGLEKLRSMETTSQRKEMVAKIKELFLANGAPFQLELITRKDILLSISDAENLKEEVKNLVTAQSQILHSLSTYWYQQYTAQVLQSTRNNEIIEESDDESELENSGMLEYHCNVIVDHGNEVFNIQVPPSATRNRLITDDPVIGGLKRNGYYRVRKSSEDTATPLISQSTQKLFPMSSVTGSPALLKSSSLYQRLKPFMQASIRCNFAAGNPILDYFNRRQLEKARNLLLFWQSTESILTSDEMKRWYKCIKQDELEPVCPYMSLFSGYPLATNLETLLELYIDDNSEFFIELSAEMQRQLHILLPRGLGRRLLLDVQEYACRALEPYWVKYILGDNDAFQVDCVSRQDLGHLSDEIQRDQSQLFHKSQSPNEILSCAFDPSEISINKKIWQAVEYAEVIDNPGLLHLPSRLSMNLYSQPITVDQQVKPKERSRVPTPGDIGPITYRGITLTPLVTTIKTITQRTRNRMTRQTVYTSQPARLGEFLKRKPPLPLSFSDMMREAQHLECFYHFLSMLGNGVELNVVFWLAIEDMKDSIGDTKMCNTKIRRIMRRFFKTEGIDITLHCQDSALTELVGTSTPSPFQLMDAQEAVYKLLETRWYSEYVKFLQGEYTKDEKSKAKETPKSPIFKAKELGTKKTSNTDGDKSPKAKKQTKVLWNMFVRNIINFKRGLADAKTLGLYKKFLTTEVLNGDISGKNKKVVGSKLINVTKLLSDLSFWAEVERYKDMADVANAAKDSGSYTPEDEIMIHKKAHAIINCYIDSTVPPRVQVNAPPEIVSKIVDNLSQGNITRSLFHEAALHSFTVLLLYWKRFLIWRWAPKSSSCASLHSLESSSRWSGINTTHHIDTYDSQMMLDGCILSFSLKSGLRLIKQPIAREKPIPIAMPAFNRVLTQSTVYRLQHTAISNHINKTEGLVIS